MNSWSGSRITSASRPRIEAHRNGSLASMKASVISPSRWTFFGQVRQRLLFNQKYSSPNSNQAGFSCSVPSTRLVPTTVKMGCATSARTAGLRAATALPPPAIDGPLDSLRLNLDLDAAGARILVVAAGVAMGEMIDVLAAGIFGPVDHAALDLGPAKHVFRVDQQQGDARVALQMLEPPSVGAPVDPE